MGDGSGGDGHGGALHGIPYHGVHPYKRLKALLHTESRDLWIAVIYSGAIGLVTLVLPVATQSLVNTIAFGTLMQPLVILTLLVFAALLFNTLLNAYRLWVVEVIQRRIFVRMAGDVTMRLVRVRPEALDREHAPELVNRFLDVVTVQKAAATLLVDGLSVAFQTVVGMALLGVYHPWLLVFDVFLFVCILIVLFPLGTGAISTSIFESKAKYSLVAWLEEIARHQLAFKAPSGAAVALGNTNAYLTDYLKHRASHFRIFMRQVAGSYTLQAIASAVLLGVGGWLVIGRQLTLGQLIAAEIVVALVISGFTKFGKHLETFYDLMAGMDKLGYLLDLPVERDQGEPLPHKTSGASVKIRNLRAGYRQSGSILQDVSCEIPSGSRVGLVGAIGSGKSTFFDVILGFLTPQSGIVEVDGVDLREVKLGDLRSQVAILRDPEIFEGSLMDNLRVASPEVDSSVAREVLDRVGLLSHVQTFPEGLHVPLTTGGRPLSPGQRVQLEIARAILRQPRLLMIDECLEQIDSLPERVRILDILFAPEAPWTLIVASQSPEVLDRCTDVLELWDGSLKQFNN